MHFAIRLMERQKLPELRGPKYLPELEQAQALAATRKAAAAAETLGRPAEAAKTRAQA
jgi:hypothetical protein